VFNGAAVAYIFSNLSIEVCTPNSFLAAGLQRDSPARPLFSKEIFVLRLPDPRGKPNTVKQKRD
jgi:hypothetical protein